jgi:hypothetical protein
MEWHSGRPAATYTGEELMGDGLKCVLDEAAGADAALFEVTD